MAASSSVLNISVLLVDDDEGLRDSMLQWLKQHNFSVDFAVTGLHAIQKIKANPYYTVIVSDIKMPGLNGLNMVKKLKQEVPEFNSKVIIMSGHATVDHIKDAKALGAFAVLVKPFKPSDLLEKINLAAEASR